MITMYQGLMLMIGFPLLTAVITLIVLIMKK